MNIEIKQENEIIVVELEGRMDTNTSRIFKKKWNHITAKQVLI